MSNYFGYVSVDALMDFAHNHVNGMIDSNDIARFPKANVKDANEQQSLQQIFGIPFARLRELAEAEREGRVVVLPVKQGTRFYAANRESGRIIEQDFDEYEVTLMDKNGWGYVASEHGKASEIFATRPEAERALAAADAGKGE